MQMPNSEAAAHLGKAKDRLAEWRKIVAKMIDPEPPDARHPLANHSADGARRKSTPPWTLCLRPETAMTCSHSAWHWSTSSATRLAITRPRRRFRFDLRIRTGSARPLKSSTLGKAKGLIHATI